MKRLFIMLMLLCWTMGSVSFIWRYLCSEMPRESPIDLLPAASCMAILGNVCFFGSVWLLWELSGWIEERIK